MLVLSYSVGLLPIDPDRVVALRSVRDVVFKRPVAIGATIRPEAEVVGERPLDAEHSLVELALRVRDADGRLVVRGTIEVLWRREASVVNGTANAHGRVEDVDLSPCVDGRVLT
jgi:acyl dehydratase